MIIANAEEVHNAFFALAGRWPRDWFISLQHSAPATKTFFRIPLNRAIELGNQIQI